mgnify:CR=1 FL=1
MDRVTEGRWGGRGFYFLDRMNARRPKVEVRYAKTLTLGEYEVLIEAEQHLGPTQLAGAICYVVRYSIVRTACRPIRGDLLSVHCYDLIDDTTTFTASLRRWATERPRLAMTLPPCCQK